VGLLDRQRSERVVSAETRDVGTPYEVWGQRGWPAIDIVGESFHSAAIRALLPKVGESGADVTVPVLLRHEADNPHDPNAVEVSAATGPVGHLSREDATRYAPAVAAFHRRGLVPSTSARIWGREDQEWDTGKRTFVGSVQIDLPEPHLLAPVNEPPPHPHLLLPHGAAMQVTGEEENMAAIMPHLVPAGECWVYATLSPVC
jgi:HIRAN domain